MNSFPDPRDLLRGMTVYRNGYAVTTKKPAAAREPGTKPKPRPDTGAPRKAAAKRSADLNFDHLADIEPDQLAAAQRVAASVDGGRSVARQWDAAFRRVASGGDRGKSGTKRDATASAWDTAFRKAGGNR